MDERTREQLKEWAETYNDRKYFVEDPIAFPRHFAEEYAAGRCLLADVEIAAVVAAHLAWGRRAMIVRDCGRAFDEMDWKPYDYVMNGDYRDDSASLHRTVKWSEFAGICGRLRKVYGEIAEHAVAASPGIVAVAASPGIVAGADPSEIFTGADSPSLEGLSDNEFRVRIYGQKPDAKAPNKKISMMRRWLVRDDGKVDLGVWKHTVRRSLLIPLDVHVHDQATALALTARKSKDIVTAREITDSFREIFPDDPCLGDFALFGYGVTHSGQKTHL